MLPVEKGDTSNHSIEFLNREHEIVKHPGVRIADVEGLILQGWLERETARREDSGIIN